MNKGELKIMKGANDWISGELRSKNENLHILSKCKKTCINPLVYNSFVSPKNIYSPFKPNAKRFAGTIFIIRAYTAIMTKLIQLIFGLIHASHLDRY